MVKLVSIAKAKAHFSEIIAAAERGEIVAVTRRGRPVVRIVSEAEYGKLVSRRRKVEWLLPVLDTRGFRLDREEANRR